LVSFVLSPGYASPFANHKIGKEGGAIPKDRALQEAYKPFNNPYKEIGSDYHRIARKFLNRLRYVWRNNWPSVPSVVQ